MGKRTKKSKSPGTKRGRSPSPGTSEKSNTETLSLKNPSLLPDQLLQSSDVDRKKTKKRKTGKDDTESRQTESTEVCLNKEMGKSNVSGKINKRQRNRDRLQDRVDSEHQKTSKDRTKDRSDSGSTKSKKENKRKEADLHDQGAKRKRTEHKNDANDGESDAKKDKNEEKYQDLFDRIFEEDTQALVVLNHPEQIALMGKVNLTCLLGTVNIYGHIISAEEKMCPIFSSESNSLISVDTHIAPDQCNPIDLKNILGANCKNKSTKKKVLKMVASCDNPVVVLLQKLESSSLDFVCSQKAYQTLFTGKWRPDNNVMVLNSIGVRIYKSHADINKLTLPRQYEKVTHWLAERLESDTSPVIIVCGGQNSGKSTFTRYLLNAALNHVATVAYLECDVGQTEFTCPGCVSLSVITQPIFGAPFTHQITPTSCCYTGAVTPGDDPGHYIKCLTYVYQKYETLKTKCPLIINTMGWTKGLGLALLTDTLRLTKPDVVVQLASRSQHKNMELITSQFMRGSSGWLSEKSTEEQASKHSLMVVNSIVGSHIEVPDYYRPFDHRNMSLLSHLGQSFTEPDTVHNFNSLRPFTVPWSQIAVHVAHTQVPRSQIMYAINASVVGLCRVNDDDIMDPKVPDYPRFLKGKPVCECYGFGVVRGIDPVQKVIYIITSLSAEKCFKVNCLLRGSVEVPSSLLMEQEASDTADSVPYVGHPKEVIGAGAVNRRRHMRRRPTDRNTP